ncbi:MAG: PIN domain-containing protein [Actinomycetota bacterium]
MADQLRSLNDIRQQLAHYEQLLRPREDERLLVCDTNALVHGKRFDTLRWNELFAERKVRIVLPLVVIDELDTIKDRGGSIKNNANRAAGAVLRELDAKLLPGQALQRMELRDNVTLQLVDEPFGHTRLEGHDDEIIRQASYFSSMSEGRTTIVARDRGMRVRAEAAGIDVIPLPLDYERADPEEPFDG